MKRAGLAILLMAQLLARGVQVPFRAVREGFQVAQGHGWRTLFLKGINLGPALPGRYPAQFPAEDEFRGWLKGMGTLGVNCLRIYTLFPPAFYEALRSYNREAAHPIYLVQGIWTEVPPRHDFEDPGWNAAWASDLEAAVRALHGDASIPPRPRAAWGDYRADVSPWWLATILGPEWEPAVILDNNLLHQGLADFQGRFLTVKGGHAAELFLARTMDRFIGLEQDRYHSQRPVAFTNWPPLDPLLHATEAKAPGEAGVALDLEKFTALPACAGGIFASYHIYPNYPDFMNLDPLYARARDREGPNNFYGYLKELRRHYHKHPVLVAESGLSSSRFSAHWQPQGMTHGGLDEKTQARMLVRILRDVHGAGYAGCILFEWMDEWFKKTWLYAPIINPSERKPYWFNAMDPEESYGLIGIHPGSRGPDILIDGRSRDWQAVPPYLAQGPLQLKLLADEGWLHLGIFWKGPRPDWRREQFLVGLSTLDPSLGNHHLPGGVPLRSEAGLEFAVEFSEGACRVWVDAPYAYAPHRYEPGPRAVVHEDGPWTRMEIQANRPRQAPDGTAFPGHRYDVGLLRRGTQERAKASFDSNGDWMEGPGFLELRIPWTLLQVTDPSSRTVLLGRGTAGNGGPLDTGVTPGFRACLARVRRDGLNRLRTLETLPSSSGGTLPMPGLFTWQPWVEPRWHEYRKPAFWAVRRAFQALPSRPREAAP